MDKINRCPKRRTAILYRTVDFLFVFVSRYHWWICLFFSSFLFFFLILSFFFIYYFMGWSAFTAQMCENHFLSLPILHCFANRYEFIDDCRRFVSRAHRARLCVCVRMCAILFLRSTHIYIGCACATTTKRTKCPQKKYSRYLLHICDTCENSYRITML